MNWILELYWKTRGISTENFRKRCKRCGYTGQAHVGFFIRGKFCMRFKPQ